MSKQIAVTDYDFPDLSLEEEIISGEDIELTEANAKTPEDIINAVPDAAGLLVQYTEITEDVFEALDELRVVGRYGIGVDNVDIEAATKHNVWVVNVPSYCEEEVSVHTLTLLLNCLRKVSLYDRDIKAGQWDWTAGKPIRRVSEQTFGFAGFGKIPQHLREIAQGFGFEFVAYDPYLSAKEISQHRVKKVEFKELLDLADIISIHMPLTNETSHLFDQSVFKQMNENAIVLNTARGSIIDINDLYDALNQGEIAGAGIDVLPSEPPENFKPVQHERVVSTPHVAWYSEESMIEMRRTVTEDTLQVLSGSEESPTNPVNDLK